MDTLIRLDAKIIAITEHFCHWFQKLTGKSNYWLAQKAYILACLTFIFYLLQMLPSSNVTPQLFMPILLMSLFCIAFISWLWSDILRSIAQFILNWKDAELEAYNRLIKGLSDPVKCDPRCIKARLRLLGTISLFFMFTAITRTYGFLLISLTLTLMLMGIYLMSCDPLPPGTETLGDKVRAFFAPKPVPVKASS